MMTPETFYLHLVEELKINRSLYPYYKLIDGSASRQLYRKAYFMQRLQYIDQQIDKSTNPAILDCGCGFGTTCLYLAMNGISTKGTSLEYYADQIAKRKQYWGQFGNSDIFEYAYENIFDTPPPPESLDYIILQDTIHHIEPIDKGLEIFYRALKKGGKMIMVEVNGSALLESFIFFLKRGNKKIIEVYDEVLQKNILMGNENFRSEKGWIKLCQDAGFQIDRESIQYIRFFLPLFLNQKNYNSIIQKEQKIAEKYHLLKKYGFFGLNMVFVK